MTSLRAGAAIVLTADQIGSRRSEDAVPAALAALAGLPSALGEARAFARTAGDEIQGLFVSSRETIAALELLARLGVWRVGVGVGLVDLPVPADVRAGSGDAFVAARAAVDAARTSSSAMAVRAPSASVSATRLEAALGLLDVAWRRRSDAGWQVAAMIDGGAARRQIAERLGVTASAVSQRAKAAAVGEAVAGRDLARWLLDETVRACRRDSSSGAPSSS